MIATKICGLTTQDGVDATLKGGASHVGFNFFQKSPRYASFELAASLIAHINGKAKSVALFVDAAPNDIMAACAIAKPDIIQLHGGETPENVAHIKALSGREVWKVIPVRTRDDLNAGKDFRQSADFILYDAKAPKGADLPGGTGIRIDWHLLQGYPHPLPWGLAGGLAADNIGEAVGISGARLIDVSSGVESAPGIKDVDKIAAFLKAASTL